MRARFTDNRHMPRRPFLIFDKSSLESLNIDEAALLDNFFSCVITPVFFVECLADLEKEGIRSRSTPEQIVGSLADRTPRYHARMSMHHIDILKWELTGDSSLIRLNGGPFLPGATSTQLGDHRGVIFHQPKEEEAMDRWMARDFLHVEKLFAKEWRQALKSIDFGTLVKAVMAEIGPRWRKPKTLQDARQMADIIIDYMDQEWLLGFGIDMLGLSDIKADAISKWIDQRRPALRTCAPHFIFMLTIDVFFCLVLPTQLLRNVKQSHQIDLAYLYYLPFCSVFTSKDNFHVQIVPLFLTPEQSFVNGIDLKEDLKKLDQRYSALDPAELKEGLSSFARHPPDDQTFLTTRLWDAHHPKWRDEPGPVKLPKQLQDAIMEVVNKVSGAPPAAHHNITSVKELDYVSMHGTTSLQKGKYHRFSEDLEQRIIESENDKG
jgi:hypothetical protein